MMKFLWHQKREGNKMFWEEKLKNQIEYLHRIKMDLTLN